MNRRSIHSFLSPLAGIAMILGMVLFGSGASAPAFAGDAPASLVLNVYTCDALNDPIDPNQTLIDECDLGTEDIAFTLDPVPARDSGAMASTGSGGAPATISFTLLAPGNYRLTQQTSPTVARAYISQCTSTIRSFEYPFSPFAIIEPGGRLNIQLLPGEELTCDWFDVQAEPRSTAALTLTAYSCSGDTIGPDQCDLAPSVQFTLTSPDGTVADLITNASGIATFDGAGLYHLEAVSTLENREFCTFDPHTIHSGADLDLDPSAPIAIDAYYCYPGA